MKDLNNFIKRLSSRKFLLTVGGIALVTLNPESADHIVFLIGLFVGGESAADTVSRYATEKTKQTTQSLKEALTYSGEGFDDNIDRSNVVSGSDFNDQQQ